MWGKALMFCQLMESDVLIFLFNCCSQNTSDMMGLVCLLERLEQLQEKYQNSFSIQESGNNEGKNNYALETNAHI